MKKHIKEHWSLLAGIVDDDEREYVREKAAQSIEDLFDDGLKETSFGSKLLMEAISFKSSEEGDVGSEHSTHPEKPDGYKYLDQDVNDPEHYDDKLHDEEEYSNLIKRGGIKVKEDYDREFNQVLAKFSLTEDWKEQIDLPGEMSDHKDPSVEVPTGLLDLLAKWKGGQSSNSYTVLTGGAYGVPKSFIDRTIEELEIKGEMRHRKGILSNEDRSELIKLMNGLRSLVEGDSDPDFSPKPSMREDDESKFGSAPESPDSAPPAMDEDSLHSVHNPNKDLVAAIVGGQGIIGVSEDPEATDPGYWKSLDQNNNWELIWLNDVPSDVAQRLIDWESHWSDGQQAAAAAVPYMGEIIDTNSDLPDIDDVPSMDDGADWANKDLVDLDDRSHFFNPKEDRMDKQFNKYF